MIDWGDFTDEPKKIAYKVEITEVHDLNGDGSGNDLVHGLRPVLRVLTENLQGAHDAPCDSVNCGQYPTLTIKSASVSASFNSYEDLVPSIFRNPFSSLFYKFDL